MTAGAPPRFDDTAIAAIQNVLAAEHAAIWTYSLAIAFLTGSDAEQAEEHEQAHRTLRNQVERTLADLGVPAVSAQPGYATPQPVTDARSAAALATVAEADALAAWRSTLERSTDRELRTVALRALTDGAVRSAHWREATGTEPAIPAFPGR